ncbi:MAG: Uncharacterized protein FD161_513 [Limisphaerales bacterium]|nr:MAG: Uncharacterized protein FD161_513 [Limisphaerales bacterium]KAG0510418.1 MAG: Uncharacterized protein E1N63_513 [Limisphaerales bacterium]TXT51605.1 MAG: Uncharacterized protein FD140_1643 [Limisphaerales bacterium]
MRSLAEPVVLLRAAIAAALTALACYPRLAHWTQRKDDVWFLVAVVGWAALVMWGAVFAWHEKHGRLEVFPKRVSPNLWLVALALGGAGAAISFHFGDPTLRQLAPTDFPRNPAQWAEHVLFNLAMEQLFLCFAPFAFFVRLLPGVKLAAVATVLFGLLVFALKLQSVSAALTWDVALGLAFFRALNSAVAVWLYYRGGVWLVWLFALLLQCRHWFAFDG